MAREMRLKVLKKEQSLDSLATDASGARNTIEIFEGGANSRKYEWRNLREKSD